MNIQATVQPFHDEPAHGGLELGIGEDAIDRVPKCRSDGSVTLGLIEHAQPKGVG
jgi:hypothetical protein